ncbi:YrpD family protein [Paenibacillus wenxiniae]|uniref:YrpD family protein n=1 Tax=Paenibacillus wenxiniae TaxID=1636843 RepID=A0ABW4RE17_9BACL
MKNLKKVVLPVLLCSLAAFPVSSVASPSVEIESTSSTTLNVFHFEDQNVSDDALAWIVQNATAALRQEKSSKLSLTATTTTYDNTTYDYITYDDQHVYLYEEAAHTTPQLVITNNTQSNTQALQSSITTLQAQSGFISDGVGGKIGISRVGAPGSYLSAKLRIPTQSQVSSDLTRYGPYNYGGFEYNSSATGGVGSWAADMGLSYYKNLGPTGSTWGWKPIIILKQKTSPDKEGWTQYASNLFPDPNNLEGQFNNGYKPGTDAILYMWYNNNGKVRLKVDGTTVSPNRLGKILADTHNITIIDSNASWNIQKISAWKLLSTVVSKDDTGRNYAFYSNIKVDGTDVANGEFITPSEDHATVTRTGNSVTINVQ